MIREMMFCDKPFCRHQALCDGYDMPKGWGKMVLPGTGRMGHFCRECAPRIDGVEIPEETDRQIRIRCGRALMDARHAAEAP